MNSKRAGLAVSLEGVGGQTSKYMFVIVVLSVGTPRVESVISYDRNIPILCSVLFHGSPFLFVRSF